MVKSDLIKIVIIEYDRLKMTEKNLFTEMLVRHVN